MKQKWTCKLDISFSLTQEEIDKYPDLANTFIDPKNPTDEEIRKHFKQQIRDCAGSNDGSELLANARFEVSESEQ